MTLNNFLAFFGMIEFCYFWGQFVVTYMQNSILLMFTGSILIPLLYNSYFPLKIQTVVSENE